MNQQFVYCFGEALWDIFPAGAKPGGAPMNVAYHLRNLGITAGIISSVGNDNRGAELLDLLRSWNISTELCNINDDHLTGTVLASIDEKNGPSYTITEQVAWDYINPSDHANDAVARCSAFVYGSLAARSNVSRNTLLHLLKLAPYKVFDINIRPPFYTLPLLSDLLYAADLVKMNETELQLLMDLSQQPSITEEDSISFIRETYHIQELLLTKGSRGAKYYAGSRRYEVPAVSITVKDTVGSGDAFLAGFLARKISGASIQDALSYASALGAFVTTKEGACPDYEMKDLNRLLPK